MQFAVHARRRSSLLAAREDGRNPLQLLAILKSCPLGTSPAGKPILVELVISLKDPVHIADGAEDANQVGIAQDFDLASEPAIAHGQVVLFAPRRGLFDLWLISSWAGVAMSLHPYKGGHWLEVLALRMERLSSSHSLCCWDMFSVTSQHVQELISLFQRVFWAQARVFVLMSGPNDLLRCLAQ